VKLDYTEFVTTFSFGINLECEMEGFCLNGYT